MPEEVLKKDLEFIIDVAYKTNIPFIASVGGGGSDVHVEKALKLVDEISREKNIRLKIAVINVEIDKEWLKDKLRNHLCYICFSIILIVMARENEYKLLYEAFDKRILSII